MGASRTGQAGAVSILPRICPTVIVPAGSLAPFAGVMSILRRAALIDSRYAADRGLIAHERLGHYQQWRDHPLRYPLRRGLNLRWMPGFVRRWSQRWIYRYEIEAYRIQLRYSVTPVADADLFARFIASRYRLDDLELKITEIKKELLQ